jgi:hypothetical protein
MKLKMAILPIKTLPISDTIQQPQRIFEVLNKAEHHCKVPNVRNNRTKSISLIVEVYSQPALGSTSSDTHCRSNPKHSLATMAKCKTNPSAASQR